MGKGSAALIAALGVEEVAHRCYPWRSAGLQTADLPRVAPGAHHALGAAGADANPDELAGGHAADRRLAAAENPRVLPVGLHRRVARALLHFIHARAAVRAKAGHDLAAHVAMAQAHVARRGRRSAADARAGLVG